MGSCLLIKICLYKNILYVCQVSALDTDETTTTTAYNTGTRPGRGHGDMDRLSDADYAEPVAGRTMTKTGFLSY